MLNRQSLLNILTFAVFMTPVAVYQAASGEGCDALKITVVATVPLILGTLVMAGFMLMLQRRNKD